MKNEAQTSKKAGGCAMTKQVGRAVMLIGALALFGGACAAADVVINEIAWAGTAASANDEWVELHNTTDADIDLAGWVVRFNVNETVIHLGAAEGDTLEVRNTIIEAGGHFLLERTDDTTVSDIPADLIYKGNLSNDGTLVELVAPDGSVIDAIDATVEGWPAGRAAFPVFPYATMERWVDAPSEDMLWVSCHAGYANGLDVAGGALSGTPRFENTRSIIMARSPQVEWAMSFTDPLSGTAILSWSATDPNGEDSALQVSISLTPDGWETDESIVENLANAGSYAWDTSGWVDGEYDLVLRVTDSEGLVTSVFSGPFAIDNTP